MSEETLMSIADAAELIVNGYAFTLDEGNIRVINLSAPSRAALLSNDGGVLETSMDDIELSIVGGYLKRNRELLEA